MFQPELTADVSSWTICVYAAPSSEPSNLAPSNFLDASTVHLLLGMNLISDSMILDVGPKSKPTKQVAADDL